MGRVRRTPSSCGLLVRSRGHAGVVAYRSGAEMGAVASESEATEMLAAVRSVVKLGRFIFWLEGGFAGGGGGGFSSDGQGFCRA
jgi:hypothetical protein